MPVVHAEPLREFVTQIFAGTGSPEEEARFIAEHLVDANLRGHDSHGVIRTGSYVANVANGVLKPGAQPVIERESETTAAVDGNWNFGQIVARFAMGVAIQKAQAYGVGVVTARNSGHIGRVGAYGEQAAAAGMAAIASVNTPGGRLVAPHGGAGRRLGTDPLVFAFPTSEPTEPFVLDMATSVAAEGKLRVALNKGAELPPQWILDGDGQPSQQPADFYNTEHPGALLPVGSAVGYKGFGLAMAVEALTGILSRAGSAVEGQRGSNGVFMLAIDIERFLPRDEFARAFGDLIGFVKTPPYREGFDEVLTAGEPERRRMRERLVTGLDLDAETWRQICEAAGTVNVAPPEGVTPPPGV